MNQTYLPATALVANPNGLVNQTYLPATALVANPNGLVNQTYLPHSWSILSTSFFLPSVANSNGLVNQTYLPATALVANPNGLVSLLNIFALVLHVSLTFSPSHSLSALVCFLWWPIPLV